LGSSPGIQRIGQAGFSAERGLVITNARGVFSRPIAEYAEAVRVAAAALAG